MLENFQGTPEAQSCLCVCRASFLMTFAMGGAPAPGSDRILVELFQILKDDAVESAALNIQYAICNMPAPGTYLLQYSCLENPRDGEAWWAAVYGVA